MQAILYCDKITDCIPVKDCPEALLPFCNVPLLEYLLHYIEQKGFQNTVLLAADASVRNFLDTLSLQMPVQYARSLASLHAHVPTLLLRRLCIPDWDMGELFTLCHEGAVRLCHADGTPTFAELHPQGSVLLEPERTASTEHSVFQHVNTPAEYREIQQELLKSRKFQHMRIGAGVRTGRNAVTDKLTILGNDCIIGDNVRLERCCLGDGVQIGDHTVLTDCVICRKSLIDSNVTLENAVVPESAVLHSEIRTAEARKHCLLPEDGICEGLPRWNTAQTALKAGASLTALGNAVSIGYSHEQGKSFAIAAAAGAVSQGADLWFAGQCTLSQLIETAHLTESHAMLWIQGEQDIRILPFEANGFPLSERQNQRIRQALEAGICNRITGAGEFRRAENFLTLWKEHCKKILPAPVFDIAVSCANPRTRAAAQELFSGGTGQRITLSLSDDGTKISAFSSESGMLRHEQLLLLSLFSMQEQNEPLVLPEDFHPAAEAFAGTLHAGILRMHVQEHDPAVIRLYHKQGVCFDGIRLFAHVLRGLELKGLSFGQASEMLPDLCTVQHELATSLPRQSVEKLRLENPDTRIQILMPPHSRLVKLRVHADSVEAAAELCTFWEKKLHAAESKHS